ncbi:hypothetical protein FE257_012600 [Aspergillus nanangensis]|uniref:EKC/KEOPS complex subunit CGI121 n=1 Tax=Aspergillus nanangensis TaxID=2582783 RepID=A0AAD4GQP7_ASPNN|nr:hypothetical protein FE257_012600 [Aspergillus nanangensis]
MSAAVETLNLSHLPLPVHLALFQDVHNAPFLRQQLISGNSDFEYALIDASMILSRSHALSAVFRAVNDSLNGRLKSRNVHSEIVYSLGATNNIADSFRKFGITDSTKNLLVVKVSVTPDITHDSVAAHLTQSIEGLPAPFTDESLSGVSDISKIKKAYKLGALSVAAVDTTNGTHAQDRKLEQSVLGAIALRGAT